MNDSYFDKFAGSYDDDLQRAIGVSGEDKNFFAHGRMKWLAAYVHHIKAPSSAILDFGCGTGSATPFIRLCLSPTEIMGVDVSMDSLQVAKSEFSSADTSFQLITDPPRERFDVAFCNGVFHHIEPSERDQALGYVFESLKPGGIFALFENNPWNPATRYVMSRCAFDRDAITLTPPETQRRMTDAGFELLVTRYLFIFPALLKALRFLEKPLSPFPFGTQYVVVGRKP